MSLSEFLWYPTWSSILSLSSLNTSKPADCWTLSLRTGQRQTHTWMSYCYSAVLLHWSACALHFNPSLFVCQCVSEGTNKITNEQTQEIWMSVRPWGAYDLLSSNHELVNLQYCMTFHAICVKTWARKTVFIQRNVSDALESQRLCVFVCEVTSVENKSTWSHS